MRQIKNNLILTVFALLSAPASSQVNNPAYADYFLVGRFGEICTMCEATVLCDANSSDIEYEGVPEAGNFKLYHFQTRTFWSQVSTIWEWFITNFNSESLASGHSRPVLVYTVNGSDWSESETTEAQISLDPATIVVGNYTIDRVNRRWLEGDARLPVGFCQRLPLWESLDRIAAQQALREAP